MEKYRILGKKGEGTFSEVLKCQNIRDGTFWAAKKMKQLYKSMDEIHQIREIRVLKQLNGHPNIIFLREIIYDKRTGTLCLIFELMNMNLYEYIRGRQRLLSNDVVCKLMYQLMKALEYIHRHSYFHRDVKPENILIKDDVLKLADFGSCRQTLSKQPFTEYISTRWYRAPECLLTNGFYRNQMDVWSAGCVMFEIITLKPLFPGSNEIDQISKIHDVLGTPTPNVLNKFQNRNTAIDFNFPPRRGTGVSRYLTHCPSEAVQLIDQLCVYDPDHRISAAQALRHSYFEPMRSQENGQKSELSPHPDRVVKTSEDQYVRPDSSSSQSSVENESPSATSNAHHQHQHHPPTLKPDFNRLIHPTGKAQSMIDTTRLPGQTVRKTSTQKQKTLYPYHQPTSNSNTTHSFYSSLSSMATNGSNHRQTSKHSPMPFLPPVSGASAFSNYSTNTGHSTSILHKNQFQHKNFIGYYPLMSYRSSKK